LNREKTKERKAKVNEFFTLVSCELQKPEKRPTIIFHVWRVGFIAALAGQPARSTQNFRLLVNVENFDTLDSPSPTRYKISN
jgi:hypothetical protein